MSNGGVKNAADEGQVRRSEKRAKDLARQRKDDMATLLTTPQGRRFIWGLMEFCGVYKESFTGNSATFYNEGRRSVGLHLLAEIVNAKPEALLEMMRAKHQEASPEPATERNDDNG